LRPDICGVLPVLQVPYREDGSVNFYEIEKLIDWAFEKGANGFAIAMVSDILKLTFQERLELMERTALYNSGRGHTIASVGAESTQQAVEYAETAERCGFSAVMAIPPISVGLSSASVKAYYRTIADSCTLPLIIQDASGYVGRSLDIDLYLSMGEEFGYDKIMFKPEAEPIGPKLSALRDATSGRAKIFEGSGGILLVDSYRRGIVGTIPGCDLLDGIAALWKALQRGEEAKIYDLYFPIAALIALQLQAGLDGFISIEKYILKKRGVFSSDRMRPPFSWSPDSETKEEIDRLLSILEKKLTN
jgi:4-hydroxy-tetrahydrodipicolinate synthase